VEKYAKMGISRDKLFVANNTVEVLPTNEYKEKNTIVFVGSLYKQKRIFELLENYKAAYTERQDIPELIVIGDGDQRSAVEAWIAENKLSAKIRLTGGIYDEQVLSAYFASAIACISPGQAGLTVLKSMGYGVPFVTTKDAVTGGEIFNINNNINGLVLDNYNEMKSVILETLTNRDRFIAMGQAAGDFYEENRQIGMMVDGFEKAINYVCGA
jgi:glycosyltransferase involved in cell wall biosynthesis